MKKVRMVKLEAGPEGIYPPGAIRYLEDAEAGARLKDGACVEETDAVDEADEPKKEKSLETPSEKRARLQREKDAAAAAKAQAEKEAQAKFEAENVAKGLNPDGSKKK